MHPKRYFIINFTDACLYIHKNEPSKGHADKTRKTIPFWEIKDCFVLELTEKPKNWEYAFCLNTPARIYILYSNCSNARDLWISAFQYVTASTLIVQSILLSHKEEQQVKLNQLDLQIDKPIWDKDQSSSR